MQICNLRLTNEVGRERIVARFDVQLTPEIRLNSLAIVRQQEGDGFRVWPPKFLGLNAASLAPALVVKVRDAAVAEYNRLIGGLKPNERDAA